MECGPRGDFRFIIKGKAVELNQEFHCTSCVIENGDYREGGTGSLENPYLLCYRYGSPTEPANNADFYWFSLSWDRGESHKSGAQLGKISRRTPHTQLTFRHVRQSVRGTIRGDYRFRLSERSPCVWDWKQEGETLSMNDISIQGKGTSTEPYKLHIWFTDQP